MNEIDFSTSDPGKAPKPRGPVRALTPQMMDIAQKGQQFWDEFRDKKLAAKEEKQKERRTFSPEMRAMKRPNHSLKMKLSWARRKEEARLQDEEKATLPDSV